MVAGAAGAALSGVPSLSLTLLAGDDLLESTRAVGAAVVPGASDPAHLVLGGTAHGVISIGWGLVLSAVLPRRHTLLAGTVAGLAIAALDLGVIGRRLPSIRELDPGPQVLDHLAFGLVVGGVVAVRRGRG